MPCTCGCCNAFENAFDAKYAHGDLADYRRNGPSKQTRALLESVTSLTNVRGATVLDIGGGVGAISHELLSAGAGFATDVDGSQAYIASAKEEAVRRNQFDRMQFKHGDFVAIADEIDAADIVTLDRVICCYPDMPSLVNAAAAHARRVLALVWPREAWWAHAGIAVFNLAERFSRYPLIQTLHDFRAVDGVVAGHGLSVKHARNVGFWQLRVYAR